LRASLLPTTLAFVGSIAGLLLTLALTLMPYMRQGALIHVPLLLSYVAAFAVLLFGYLSYRAFNALLSLRRFETILRHSLASANAADQQANSALKAWSEALNRSEAPR